MKANDIVFPLSHGSCYDTGIRTRDYIAIQAMTAIIASPNFHNHDTTAVAKDAYKVADAMIEQSEVRDE